MTSGRASLAAAAERLGPVVCAQLAGLPSGAGRPGDGGRALDGRVGRPGVDGPAGALAVVPGVDHAGHPAPRGPKALDWLVNGVPWLSGRAERPSCCAAWPSVVRAAAPLPRGVRRRTRSGVSARADLPWLAPGRRRPTTCTGRSRRLGRDAGAARRWWRSWAGATPPRTPTVGGGRLRVTNGPPGWIRPGRLGAGLRRRDRAGVLRAAPRWATAQPNAWCGAQKHLRMAARAGIAWSSPGSGPAAAQRGSTAPERPRRPPTLGLDLAEVHRAGEPIRSVVACGRSTRPGPGSRCGPAAPATGRLAGRVEGPLAWDARRRVRRRASGAAARAVRGARCGPGRCPGGRRPEALDMVAVTAR